MKELAEAGKIMIGVKYDQPGIGFKGATDDMPTGFDPEIAKILAAELGIDPEDIDLGGDDLRQPRAVPREGTVDLVLASYSITDERRQIVGQAGPYYVTGQQLLVEGRQRHQEPRRPQGQGGLLGHRLDVDREHRGGGRRRRAASTPTPSASTR